MSDKKTFNLDNQKIFIAGTHNGVTITEADLDEIVKSFAILKGRKDAPLKLGHDPDQKFLQRDGYPAAGWVSDVKRIGKDLIASFVNIPRAIKELIDVGAYKKFSSEIAYNWKDGSTGEAFKRVLCGVALLGADIPAVSGLNEIAKLYNDENISSEKMVVIDFKSESQKDVLEKGKENAKNDDDKKNKQEEIQMTEQEKEIATLKKENEDLKSKTHKFSSKEADLLAETKALKEKLEEKEKADKANEINAFIDANSKEDNMRILPKHKELVFSILDNVDSTVIVEFSENNEKKSLNLKDSIKKFIADLPDMKMFSVESADTKKKTTFESLDEFAEDYQKQNPKASYEEAITEGSRLYPHLDNEGGVE